MSYRVFIPSGAGSPGFGGIVECLSELPNLWLLAGDMNPNAYGKSLANEFISMPQSNSSDYTDSVIKAALNHHCSVILPITTAELYPLSLNKQKLEENGLHIAISDYQSLNIANNKARLYSYLTEEQLPCVHFRSVKNKKELATALLDLGFPTNPLVMKPAEGNGSRGFKIIQTLDVVKNEFFHSKAGSLLISPESLALELPDVFPGEMLICEYLPGTEYSVDLLVNHGKILTSAIRIREKTVSGISVKGSFVVDKKIQEMCHSITQKLNLHGPIGMQFKRDIHEEAKILEINPRLQGAVSTARFVGINFPLLSVKLALGEIMENTLSENTKEASFSRFWKDLKDR